MNYELQMSQRGFSLAGLLVILTVLAVVLAYTVPTQWSAVMKREREHQTIFVMEQYARGIQEFNRKTGGVPTKLEQLEEFNNPRVMRRLYENPLSGELDWILVPPGADQPGGQPGATPGQGGAGGVDRGRPAGRGQGAGSQEQTAGGADYVGPFIGVRPPQTGESVLELNGATRYEEWSFTVNDLQQRQPGGGGQQQQQPTPGAEPPG
jgi:type II secretory pathway pseudopilin PulG